MLNPFAKSSSSAGSRGPGILASVAVAAVCGAAMTTVSFAQAPAAGGTVSFTAEQVARGENAYQASCSGCHGTTLGGEGEAPGVIGSGFRDRRFSGTADTFFLFLKERMPQQDPGSLTDQEYADIVAFLMDANGFEAGTEELPADPAVLATLNNPPAP